MFSPEHVLEFFSCLLQLAKDLLNPSPEEEKRKHKLKRLVQSPNSFFMDVKCPGKIFFLNIAHHTLTALHGCRMLQNHNSFQPCTDSGALCELQYSAGTADRWQSKTHRR